MNAQEIWKDLSDVNVNEHTEKKGRFTYLTWTWAWAYVKKIYPTANYELLDDIHYPDGTMEVRFSVTIEGLTHTMWLAVMDNKNNAIKNPNSTAVNKARMRCLVKCLAMFGLGHYIYAGEDLPDGGAEAPVTFSDIDTSDEVLGGAEEIATNKNQKSKSVVDHNPQTADEATIAVDGLVSIIRGMCSTVGEAKSMFDANKELVDNLEKNFPDERQRLKNAMGIFVKQLGEMK